MCSLSHIWKTAKPLLQGIVWAMLGVEWWEYFMFDVMCILVILLYHQKDLPYKWVFSAGGNCIIPIYTYMYRYIFCDYNFCRFFLLVKFCRKWTCNYRKYPFYDIMTKYVQKIKNIIWLLIYKKHLDFQRKESVSIYV